MTVLLNRADPLETPSARRSKPPLKAPRVLLHVALAIWGLASVIPLVWMISASLQTNAEIYGGVHLIPKSPQWSNFVQAWQQSSFSVYFVNSVIYTVAVVAGTVFLASLSAYAFARMRFPGKRALYGALLVFLFIPIPGAFIPLYLVLANLHLLDTQLGYILPMINGSLPVAMFILRAFFEQLPKELEEAAFIDGASRLQVFTKIAFPLARPAVATVVILTVLGVWNEYVLASVVFSNQALLPLQVGLLAFQGSYFSQYGLMMAATTITTLPIVIVYLMFQKNIIRGVMAGAVKG
ncbi:MAG: carbohydrate ABC transporter permease [Cellulomonas sp.]